MDELEVTWMRAASVWWAFIWRSLLVGFAAGFVIALLGAIAGFDPEQSMFSLLIYLALIPIGIWIFKVIMSKQYKGFRIALLPVVESSTIPERLE